MEGSMEVRAVVRRREEEAEEVEGMVGRCGRHTKAEDKVGRHAETANATHRTCRRQCRCGCLILAW